MPSPACAAMQTRHPHEPNQIGRVRDHPNPAVQIGPSDRNASEPFDLDPTA
jgi:hypothetical protein